MRLTDIQTFIVGNPWKNWVFLKLHTDAGICGVGEATLHRKARTMEAALAETRRYFLGIDPFAVERLIDEMLKVGRGPVHVTALSGVEIACYDIAGKALGTPVYNLLGGPYRRRIRAYANGWYTGPQTAGGVCAEGAGGGGAGLHGPQVRPVRQRPSDDVPRGPAKGPGRGGGRAGRGGAGGRSYD
jgi:L-alanine-DL-glutamate epimerase-like enolase superfamily enzyme